MANNGGDKGSTYGVNVDGSVSVRVRPSHCVTVTPMHGFHSFLQTKDRHNLSMQEAKRAIADQSNNLERFMINRKLTAIRAELAAEKAASNKGRGRVRGNVHVHPPRRLGWPSQGFWGGWRGERCPTRMTVSWEIQNTARGRGGPPRLGRGLSLH